VIGSFGASTWTFGVQAARAKQSAIPTRTLCRPPEQIKFPTPSIRSPDAGDSPTGPLQHSSAHLRQYYAGRVLSIPLT